MAAAVDVLSWLNKHLSAKFHAKAANAFAGFAGCQSQFEVKQIGRRKITFASVGTVFLIARRKKKTPHIIIVQLSRITGTGMYQGLLTKAL